MKKDVELDILNSNQIKTKTKSVSQLFTFNLTQCKTWGCLDEDRADILTLAEIDERYTRSSSFTALSISLFLVFTAVRLEKLTSHRCVVENWSNVKIAL